MKYTVDRLYKDLVAQYEKEIERMSDSIKREEIGIGQ